MGLAPEIPNFAPAIQLQQGWKIDFIEKKNGFYQVFIIFLMMQSQP